MSSYLTHPPNELYAGRNFHNVLEVLRILREQCEAHGFAIRCVVALDVAVRPTKK